MDNPKREPTHEQLTQRELEILRLVADGLSNQDIAARLFISLNTVKWHLKQIYGKLYIGSRTQAIAFARTTRLLSGTVETVESSVPPHNLPQQPTLFVGRIRELEAIVNRLEDPACRLLTVVGPGGIGKTRLALQAAEQQAVAYGRNVYFVSLAPVTAPESIVSAIAEAIRFSFYPGREPKQQLLDYLRGKQMLILLDNFEHLLAAASLVAEILEAAPRVKILATSRERLNVRAETILSLDGMDYPPQELAQGAAEYGAVKLFWQSAAQVQADFPLNAVNLTSVSHICRLVQGMPLGILLAAAWVGVLSLQEIAQEIQKSLNFLESDQRDLPERQRSLRAAFDHSWKLLGEKEREAFRRLSVFRGSFTREAAEQVGGASLKLLMAMVNKSLLRRDSATGRYEIHELLRQYGEAQLNGLPLDSEHIHDIHCAYYADYMHTQWNALISLGHRAVFEEINVEASNILESWKYAVEKCRFTNLRTMALPLWYFADKRIPFPVAEQFFRRAVTALQSVASEKENEILCGLLLALQGWFASDTTSKALVSKSLLILRQYDCPEETVVALFIMGLIAGYRLRDFAEGEKVAREGAQIARAHDIQWALGHCLLHIGYCLRAQGHLEQARQVGQECLKISEPIGNLWIMAANAVIVLGGVAMDRGDYPEAERQIEQSLQWYREVEFGYPWAGALCCEYLAKVALLTHQYDKAKSWLQQSLSFFQKAGKGIDREAGEALFCISRLFAAWGSTENAVEILSAISQIEHPPQDHYVGDLATASLAELQAALPTEIYAAAVERGKLLDLNTVIAEFLAL